MWAQTLRAPKHSRSGTIDTRELATMQVRRTICLAEACFDKAGGVESGKLMGTDKGSNYFLMAGPVQPTKFLGLKPPKYVPVGAAQHVQLARTLESRTCAQKRDENSSHLKETLSLDGRRMKPRPPPRQSQGGRPSFSMAGWRLLTGC